MNKVGPRGIRRLTNVTQLIAELRLYVYIQQIFMELWSACHGRVTLQGPEKN